MPARLAATAGSRRSSFGRARRCLLVFLTGGPPQLDTWDLKPDAPVEIRGELRPIPTNAPGVNISELFPRLARHADKYCLVRSVTHADSVHTSAGYTMLTGAYHPQANSGTAKNIRPTAQDHPHLGSLLGLARSARSGPPVFASLPEVIKDAGVNEFPGQGPGFLGKQYEPFRIQANEKRSGFQLPDLLLPADITAGRLGDRKLLRAGLERGLRSMEGPLTDMDNCYRRALTLLATTAVRDAFHLEREPARLRESYGMHLFGQGCLLARRLLEAGVSFVTVYWHYEGPDDSPVWDTHENNYPHLRRRLMPPTDAALSALLADLAQRGLLQDTLVVCLGEFGRSPRINRHGGRDHGNSDRTGGLPWDRLVTPPDLAATLLHLLGVDPNLEVHDPTHRPLRACEGTPVVGIMA